MNFIKTEAYFRDSGISDDMWESFSDEQRDNSVHLTPCRFDQKEIFFYNASSNGKGVTLRFKNGYDIIVNMTIEEADKLFTGLPINR